MIFHEPGQSVEDALQQDAYDGPYDSGQVQYDPDGTTQLLSSGWPFQLPVVRQRGDILELPEGVRLQVSPAPPMDLVPSS